MQSRSARRHAAGPARSPLRRGLVAAGALLLVGGAVAVPVALASSASAAAMWKHCPPGQSVVLVFEKSGGTIVIDYADGVSPKPGDGATIVDKSTWTWTTPQRTIASVLVDTGYGPNWVPKGPSSHGGTVSTPGETIVALTLCGKDSTSPTVTPTSPTPTSPTATTTKTPTPTPTTTCDTPMPSSPGTGSPSASCGPPHTSTPTPTPTCDSVMPSSPGGGGSTPTPSCGPTSPTPTGPTPTITGGTSTPTPTPTRSRSTTPTPTTTGGTTTPGSSTTPAGGTTTPSTWAGTTLPHTGAPSTGLLTGGAVALAGGVALLALSVWRRPARGAHRR